jgi:hypothetical protein
VEPLRMPLFKTPGLFVAAVVLIAGAILIWLAANWLPRNRTPARGQAVTFISAVYVCCYMLGIVAAMLFFDASTKFKLRILAPVYMALLILLVAAGAWVWSRRPEVVMLVGIAIVGLSAYGQYDTVSSLAKGGQGYASFKWYDSSAMSYLRGLPADTHIYTNEPGAVYLYTGRGTYVLPDRVDPVTAEVRPGFNQGLMELQADVNSGQAVLALFSGGDSSAVNAAELSRGLYLAQKSAGAEIYTAAP